ncbi:hypothetical protein NTD89_05465 [Pseudomonas sp. 14P_5.3_Bac1]|uniref:hypothetical protein n=1 Tax=Pseudomonas sp. 14P_5.3_Bac1 TaxID=2971622 RepID=UPI0021CA19BC|nr:hypothetical protein [Pseudomonas sp. 14P_5.3_Bac1]MCU1776458.1 hypothetical protein [Pseudomonas sp. 14P_5.3_Bac1]
MKGNVEVVCDGCAGGSFFGSVFVMNAIWPSLIVLIVDNSCMMSLWAAEHFCEDIVRLNGNEPVANLYTLVTNHAPWGGTEFLEYIDEDDEGAAARKYIIEGYKYQSRVYCDARQLEVPMLRTFMTKAHAMETEKSNRAEIRLTVTVIWTHFLKSPLIHWLAMKSGDSPTRCSIVLPRLTMQR